MLPGGRLSNCLRFDQSVIGTLFFDLAAGCCDDLLENGVVGVGSVIMPGVILFLMTISRDLLELDHRRWLFCLLRLFCLTLSEPGCCCDCW